MDIQFVDELKLTYHRSGFKNIRCFPDCCKYKHYKTWHCGRGIEIDVLLIDPSLEISNLSFFGSIEPDNLEMFMDDSSELYQGNIECKSYNQLLVTFNKGTRKWPYPWKGARALSSKTRHCFNIYVYYNNELIRTEKSNSFTFYSLR